MFRIEITAGSPIELAEAIRALAPIAYAEGAPTQARFPAPENIKTIEATAEPADQAPEPEAKPARKPRARKAEESSAAQAVGSDEKNDPNQIDIEEKIAEQPAEVAPLTMTRDELKTWIISDYLNKHLAQEERPAAFKAVMQEAGVQNFTSAPDDALPKIKAIVDRKIAETPEIK